MLMAGKRHFQLDVRNRYANLGTTASDDGVDERLNKIMLILEKSSPSDVAKAVFEVNTARADYDGNSKYARCKQCSKQHQADDEFIHCKCRRYRDGQWSASEFVKVSPRLAKKGMHKYQKSTEEYWRYVLKTYYEKFQKETKVRYVDMNQTED